MKKWVVKESWQERADVVDALLRNRGITDSEKEEFLNPLPISEYIKKLPVDFKEALKKAREEILSAIKQNLPIVIHGDYDADGICATAILYKTIRNVLNYDNVVYFVPNRFDHGYGLSAESVKEISKTTQEKFDKSGGLIITVDCGITAEDLVVSLAREQGFRIIITDHHQRKETAPDAEVTLWNDDMVGAGVALILSIILGLKDETIISLAGVATVTDLAPLKGFNRSLVKKSLSILSSKPPMGINSLLSVAGRSGDISVYDLGYIIGPRLNASGRLESAYDSLELLLEEGVDKCGEIASRLNAINSERQSMTQKMFELADRLCSETKTQNVIVTSSSEFHEGVIGLVAGKIAQKYYRPALAISINGDTAKGSARSVNGVNIVELLRHFEDRFLGLGGHPMAAGFSLKMENLEVFTKDFVSYATENISADLLVSQINVDTEIPLGILDIPLVAQLDKLRPYGIGNPEPLFLSRNVGVAGCSFVGRDSSHLSMKLYDGQNTYKAIYFDAKSSGIAGLELGSSVDIVYTAAVKEFNGRQSVDLIVKDLVTL